MRGLSGGTLPPHMAHALRSRRLAAPFTRSSVKDNAALLNHKHSVPRFESLETVREALPFVPRISSEAGRHAVSAVNRQHLAGDPTRLLRR